MTTNASPTTDDALPDGWRWALLGEVAKLARGVSYTKKDEVHDGGHKVLRANNIAKERAQLDLSEIKYVSASLWFSPDKKLLKDDIFICLASGSKDHIGKVALVADDTDCYFGAFMGAVRVDHRQIGSTYLFHQLQHSRFNQFLRSQISSTNINNLSAKVLYRFPIPLPPLSEQERIARVLDECLSSVARAKYAAEAQLAAAVALPAAYLRQALPAEGDDLPAGWRWARLGEVCEEDKTTIKPSDESCSSMPYLSLEHVESETGNIDLDNGSYDDREVLSNTFSFSSEHVLYGKLRPYLNKVALPDFSGRCTTEIIPLIPKDATRGYLARVLRRPESVQFAMRDKTGSRMPRTDMKAFMKLPVPLPSLDEQERIASELDARIAAAGALASKIRERLEAIDALPGAYLGKAFAGGI